MSKQNEESGFHDFYEQKLSPRLIALLKTYMGAPVVRTKNEWKQLRASIK